MLTPLQAKSLQAHEASFAIVASLYNARYVNAMLRAAKAQLKRAGAREIRVLRVPGAYEIPVVAARLARTPFAEAPPAARRSPRIAHPAPPSAIICLGVILRGQTVHAAHIGEAVSQALMQIQVQWLVPVIHEVLLLENEDQARARCLSRTHNRGAEAAQTALAMARLMRQIRPRAGYPTLG
jgi:6,7-dimethyl-8-ribityllumazine synthase